jgi:hypothetical protein
LAPLVDGLAAQNAPIVDHDRQIPRTALRHGGTAFRRDRGIAGNLAMTGARRKIAFVVVASDQGTLIVNRLDYRMVDATRGYGVGYQILESSSFDPEEVGVAMFVLNLRRQYHGDGVFALDCGANIGVHTVEWAKQMSGWGSVLAIEAQERIFYALAGNIALNNCFNAKAMHRAVAAEDGTLRIPEPDPPVLAVWS